MLRSNLIAPSIQSALPLLLLLLCGGGCPGELLPSANNNNNNPYPSLHWVSSSLCRKKEICVHPHSPKLSVK